MFPWSTQPQPREDLRKLQARFDREGRAAHYAQLRRDAARLGHDEPHPLIAFAVLLLLAAVATVAVAALPGGSAGL